MVHRVYPQNDNDNREEQHEPFSLEVKSNAEEQPHKREQEKHVRAEMMEALYGLGMKIAINFFFVAKGEDELINPDHKEEEREEKGYPILRRGEDEGKGESQGCCQKKANEAIVMHFVERIHDEGGGSE